ncbi:membrane integrity-associated transporter subunit PqiC [Bordetella sp. LUAb4]|uniref:PqiC family protein n=1 Tax=Bordetella sp. LUAb4 TaxID=2843195 RepID=UPI001E3B3589|nr:PqiC family protein [Bordetella sp. LUAb4]
MGNFPSMTVAAVSLSIALSACTSTPPAQFYTLNAQTPQANVQATTPMRIVIDSVSVPELVDRPQFVLRTGPAQVRIDEFSRWAEPLKEQIARVLAADLAQSFPGALVSTSARWDEHGPSYRVSVEIQTFESVPGNTATIAALWTIRASTSGNANSGRTVAQKPVSAPNHDALVDAHSQALMDVSADIARAIRQAAQP